MTPHFPAPPPSPAPAALTAEPLLVPVCLLRPDRDAWHEGSSV
ncbi:hypothetical protein [Streptomyces sp. NPDC014894]